MAIFNASALTCTISSQATLFFLKFIPPQRRWKYQNHPDLALESSRVYLNECLTLRAIFTNNIFLFIAKPQVEKKTKSHKKEWSGRLRRGVTDHVIVFVFANRSYSSKKMISTLFQKKILKSAWLSDCFFASPIYSERLQNNLRIYILVFGREAHVKMLIEWQVPVSSCNSSEPETIKREGADKFCLLRNLSGDLWNLPSHVIKLDEPVIVINFGISRILFAPFMAQTSLSAAD